jgi:hypothetical protein
MRASRGVVTLVAAALTVPLLAGCASREVTGSQSPSRELGAALRAWSGFPARASRRPLVLAGPDIVDPPNRFPGAAAKLAYLERAVRFPSSLPPGPARAGGFHLINARQAVALFQSGAAHDPPAGIRLRVTTIRFGTGVFLTDRGPRRLPAWLLGLAGIDGPAAILAVAPGQIFNPPAQPGSRPPFVDRAILGPGGHTLTVSFTGARAGHGPCTATYRLRVASSAAAVAIAVTGHSADGSGACSAVGYERQATTRLSAALGARVLVDAVSRTAVLVSS